MKVIVVGSGPAGVAAATALLENGHKVTMIDYGNDISPHRQKSVDKIAEISIDKWDEKILSAIKYPVHEKFNNKLAYGEDFPYRDSLNLLGIVLKNCGFYPSLATGGLSNVWGGAVLPYVDKDLEDWPISSETLAPFYEKVNQIMSVATYSEDDDQLINDYPLYKRRTIVAERKLSTQTKEFYHRLKRHKNYFFEKGVKIGFARNAFNSELCTECGLCMWGCPHHLIYNSKQTLQKLKLNKNFDYIKDILVTTFKEIAGGGVQVAGRTKVSMERIAFDADKLFLACGVLSTAKIIMESMQIHKPIFIKQSTHFLFPIIDFGIKGDFVSQSHFNTLSQLFIEINNQEITRNTVHLQVYPYNDMITRVIKFKLGVFYKMLFPIIKFFLNKTIIVQGFFHSNDSSHIHAYLDESKTLNVVGINQCEKEKVKVKKVIKILGKTGLIPGYEISIPGRSYHCGGTFPMKGNNETVNNNIITTNILGLLKNTRNIHVVDASVFPSIPAQTITYTVMANAYRIGSSL